MVVAGATASAAAARTRRSPGADAIGFPCGSHRKASCSRSSSGSRIAATRWKRWGGKGGITMLEGRIPVGSFLHPGGRYGGVNGEAPSPGDDFLPRLDGLGEVTGLELRLAFLSRGDEEHSPKDEQQLWGWVAEMTNPTQPTRARSGGATMFLRLGKRQWAPTWKSTLEGEWGPRPAASKTHSLLSH